jgi:transposase
MWKKCKRLNKNQIKELQLFIAGSQTSGKETRRAQAVLLLDKEESIEAIKAITSYERRYIFEARKKYLTQGIEGLKDKRKKKVKELLTSSQKEEIARFLKIKSPQDFDYENNYWTTDLLADLIKVRYKVQYKSKTSYYLLFHQAKFTYHKPGRVYQKRDEKEVKTWKKTTQPVLKKALSEENTVVLAEDEMLLSTQTTTQKIWLPQGGYPKIEVSHQKENRSVYGFLNIKTGREHAFKALRQTMYHTKEALEKIRQIYPEKKILLLWDGPGWHRGSKVQDFIKEDGHIQTLYFPRYSPEENPQEHVWKSGRSKTSHNRFIQDIDRATDEFIGYLNNTKFPYSLLGYSAKM